MDPSATLAEMLALSARILDGSNWNDTDAEALAALTEALDEWIRDGGFLPDEWNR